MTTNTPRKQNQRNHIPAADVKRAAKGRWLEILAAAGLPREILDGREHPCPKCVPAGTDRFTTFPDFEQTGGVMCRQCFSEKNGDGLAAVQWWRDCLFPEAIEWVAEYLGLRPLSEQCRSDVVADVARAKRMPLDAFHQFGVAPAKRGKKVVARVPVYDERGEVHSYFDLTPDGKGWFKSGPGNAGLFFPARLPQPGETWLVVEGVKDAAALVGLEYLAAGLNTGEMHEKYGRLFTKCHIVIVPDLDSAGTRGAERTAARLAGVASSIRVARLPGEIKRSGGDDVRDVLVRNGKDAVRAAIDDATSWQPCDVQPDDERPDVLVTFDEAAVADEVLRHLAKLGWDSPWLSQEMAERSRLFQRGGVLVHVLSDDVTESSGITLPEDVPQIRTVPKSRVREAITQSVRLVVEARNGDDVVTVPKRPPEWLVQSIHQRGDFGLARKLAGITRTPTLRLDGTLLQSRGYDPKTGLLYLPDREFPQVPDRPTRDDAIKAAGELRDVVSDFPFEGDAHCSIWIAAVLTLLARPAICGPCPLFAFDANTRGAGKTLLADVAGIIATGSGIARMAWPGSNKEVRKSITSIALEGWPVVLFDNVAATLGGEALDAALTGTTWQDRILGESRTTGLLPLTTVWLATGNNLELSADTARRVLMSRLMSLEEHPEDRTDFHRKDLRAYVRAERPRLAVAGLTILRAYFAAGCPEMQIPPWGSFEAWSRLIRHSLVWVGYADPWLTRGTVRDADQSSELVRLIHAGIEEADVDGKGVTTAEIERLLSHPVNVDDSDPWTTLRNAVTELCGDRCDSKTIGYRLRKYRGRVCAGKRLVARGGHGGVKRYSVEHVERLSRGGDGADGGDVSLHSGAGLEIVTSER